MDYTIIDAHAHLWLRQDTVVDGFPIRTLENGQIGRASCRERV